MNVLLGALVVVGTCAIAVSAMLLVRRRAQEGSYFSDGDRASGVFGVLATGFSVLLAFIIFLAFQSYDDSRLGARDEATIVAQQVETAQYLPEDGAAELTGELVCYGRYVVGTEWIALEAGTVGDPDNPWGAELSRTLKSVNPQTPAEQSAYEEWMDRTIAREQARNDRIHGADGIIPLPLWLILLTIAAVVFVYMLFFADRGERAATQALLMASITIFIVSSLLLILFFHKPYAGGLGALRPTAMERSLRIIDARLELAGLDLRPPCDVHGKAF